MGNGNEAIPESLLSVSKDGRYVQQCQELLEKIVSFPFEQKEPLDGLSDERNLEARKHASWIISCILYMMMSATTGRTLGMEALGLEFATHTNFGTGNELVASRRRRFVWICLSVLSAAMGTLVWDYVSIKDSAAKDDEDDPERSRGNQRRLIYERMRRQMLERAANLSGADPVTGENSSSRKTQQQSIDTGDNPTLTKQATNRVVKIFRELFKLVYGVYCRSDGPHNLVQNTDNEDDSGSTVRSIALWIVRLHLANFLVTGKYPTIIHRFLGLESRKVDKTTTIVDRPGTNKAIAAMLLLQASTSLIQNTFHNWAAFVAKLLEARARRNSIHRSKEEQLTKSQLRTKLDKVFDNKAPSTAKRGRNRGNPILCAICRLERKNPAAPSSCGHVLCWNCLMQWVSTVRPECPICRAPCAPKDVLPLHNYEPSS